jgi:hypothetical protein
MELVLELVLELVSELVSELVLVPGAGANVPAVTLSCKYIPSHSVIEVTCNRGKSHLILFFQINFVSLHAAGLR